MYWPSLADGFTPEVLWRIGLAFVAGTVLGIERERRGRAAGLRTTLLLCLAACAVMLISDHYYRQSVVIAGANSWHPDPMRLAAGLLSGMGFLGAGVILHLRRDITRGVTTATTLWLATIVGLCFGAGAHGVGLLTTTLALVVLWWMPRLEWGIHRDRFGEVVVLYTRSTISMEELSERIESHGVAIKHLDWREEPERDVRRVRFEIRFKQIQMPVLPRELVDDLSRLPGMRVVHWRG
jgi:putative Mg2+ transporter-C (MgtC) family protein